MSHSDATELVANLVSIIAAILQVILPITAYVINSLALRKCMKHFGSIHYNYAWIPFLNYMELTVCTQMPSAKIFGKVIPMYKFKWWFPVTTLSSCVCCCLSVPAFIIQLICCGWMFTTLFDMLDGNKPTDRITAIGALSGIVPFYAWYRFLSIKD